MSKGLFVRSRSFFALGLSLFGNIGPAALNAGRGPRGMTHCGILSRKPEAGFCRPSRLQKCLIQSYPPLRFFIASLLLHGEFPVDLGSPRLSGSRGSFETDEMFIVVDQPFG